MTQLIIVCIYLTLLLGLGLSASRLFRGTSKDYLLASHSIGPFLLLMSLFGTTMTAFALVGSTGEAFAEGVGVYGMLASSSGIIHSLCFFLIGVKLWSFGRRHGYTTQAQFFRDRLESDRLGLLLFPILVGLVIPYLLIGVIAAGATIAGVTAGTFDPGTFPASWEEGARGGVPSEIGSLVICGVVLVYVFFGGMRGTAWANAFQTVVFMVLGLVTFVVIAKQLGERETLLESLRAASAAIPEEKASRVEIGRLTFFTYLLVPLSVGMFPHLFQHWLTARSAATFKLPVVAHPLMIMVVWLPCVLMGAWAAGVPELAEIQPNLILPVMVRQAGPLLSGLLTAGILAAIMSSLDSQFLCIGTIFTTDIVLHYRRGREVSEREKVLYARLFIVAIVAITYGFSLLESRRVFTLGVWCFSGFSSLFPLVLAAVYWRRLTKAGAYASVLAAAISWAVLFWQSQFGLNPNFTVAGMMPVVVMVAASSVALVVVSLVSRPPSEATLAKFFRE
ncbi:MAG: sodium:solute symporter family protein [Planctomycetota bacterium]|nr:MAG: sodium:solute symporter family protein [Planctomycetota bacterium]REJ92875.1 MAG: sodium:solute symporter family protein [Planctomycetota bacterium]REK27912.1 MAG: sodium:solute symporter family protein [Planctomycetota bacterium]REK40351.1 MAG: sodium:solute symporter family protein [Planctomycetota bacterium]